MGDTETERILPKVGDLETHPANPPEDEVKLREVANADDFVQHPAPYFDYADFAGYTIFGLPAYPRKTMPPVYWNVHDTGQDHPEVASMPLQDIDVQRDILDDFTVLVIGRRRSGKSWLVRDMLYQLQGRFPCGVVITATKHNNFWARHVPVEFIHDVEDLDFVLEAIFRRQIALMKDPELDIDPRLFIILDDVLKEKYKLRFSKQLSRAFTDGRHYKIFVVVTLQDPLGVPPDLRENADLVVMFRTFQETRKEVCANHYLDYIEDKKIRKDFLWNHTGFIDASTGELLEDAREEEQGLEPGPIKGTVPQALVVLQAQLTGNLMRIMKRYVARDPGSFLIGAPRYWEAMASGQWLALAQRGTHAH